MEPIEGNTVVIETISCDDIAAHNIKTIKKAAKCTYCFNRKKFLNCRNINLRMIRVARTSVY